MKELTICLKADLTFITDSPDELLDYALSDDYKDRLTQTIKDDLVADDIQVADLKIFILDKEETDERTEEETAE